MSRRPISAQASASEVSRLFNEVLILRPGEHPDGHVRSSGAGRSLRRTPSPTGCTAPVYNPLYQSGTIAVALLLVLIVTGIWLVLFYRIGTPWESVARITGSPWTGRWVRGGPPLRVRRGGRRDAGARHPRLRAAAHLGAARARVGLGRRAPRAAAALRRDRVRAGVGRVRPRHGGGDRPRPRRAADSLRAGEPHLHSASGRYPARSSSSPSSSTSPSRWHGARALAPRLPYRPARPCCRHDRSRRPSSACCSPRRSCSRWGLDPEGTRVRLPGRLTVDWLYAWWLPLTSALSPGAVWLLAWPRRCLPAGPALDSPRARGAPAFLGGRGPLRRVPAVRLGLPLRSHHHDLPRATAASDVVARVDPDRCVSCGICAGSCAPMGVGPPGRTGRDQIERVRAFLADPGARAGRGDRDRVRARRGRRAGVIGARGRFCTRWTCAGNLHTSVVELLLRGGAGGVLVLPCHSARLPEPGRAAAGCGPGCTRGARPSCRPGGPAADRDRRGRRGGGGRVAAAVRELRERVPGAGPARGGSPSRARHDLRARASAAARGGRVSPAVRVLFGLLLAVAATAGDRGALAARRMRRGRARVRSSASPGAAVRSGSSAAAS